MTKVFVGILLIFLNTFTILKAQERLDFGDLESDEVLKFSKDDKVLYEYAVTQIKEYEYLYAITPLDTLLNHHPDNVQVKYLLSIAEMYDANREEAALVNLKALADSRTILPYYDFSLAKCLEKNDRYDEATKAFEMFLSESKDEELNALVKKYMAYCRSEDAMKNKLAEIEITNLGGLINTENSEYVPMIPSDGSFMVYTYRGTRSTGGKQSAPGTKSEKGHYFEDVFIAHLNDSGQWANPEPIKEINTNGHDACVSISSDGQKIYLFRNTGSTNGDIFESNLKGNHWSEPHKVLGINSEYWEGSACLSPYGKTIYFSSERPGGLGGKDLYKAELDNQGHWVNIKNLGPNINTKEDEDAPFVTADGKCLYYSSKGHESMGGYDIFRSDIKNGTFTKAFNLGMPLNTVHDEIYYVVSADGKKGYYSSDKKNGHGQQDIYVVEPGMFGKPVALVLLSGTVRLDNIPTEAKIDVVIRQTKKVYSSIKSNSITGKYLLTLPSGHDYLITVKLANIDTFKYSYNTSLIDSFVQQKADIDLFTNKFEKLKNLDSLINYENAFSRDDINYEEFAKKYGNAKNQDVKFKVQIGAFRNKENFKYFNFVGLPEVIRETNDDNITRFTMGNYETFNEAYALLDASVKKGIKDAFIVAIYKNKRTKLKFLIANGILK